MPRRTRRAAQVFELLGFKAIAKHRHKDVTLYRQGGVNFLINAEPDSFAQRFARLHGPSICAIGSASRTPPKPTSAHWNWAPGASTRTAARWS